MGNSEERTLESPRKRMKLSEDPLTLNSDASGQPPHNAIASGPTAAEKSKDMEDISHVATEADVGITDYVSPSVSSFAGILKKR